MADLLYKPTKKEKELERNAAYQRARRRKGSDVGEIPQCKDPERRERCRFDLVAFLTTYFPNTTGLSPFGEHQLNAIRRFCHCVLRGGKFINMLPRGYCKSTISECATIWAALYGHKRYIMFLGSNEVSAKTAIDSIQKELMANPLLAEDFPEVCYPIRKSEGKHQRAKSQTIDGEKTGMEWKGACLVLPSVKGSLASGIMITSDGLLSASRGARHKMPDGSNARPELVVLDDPQTDQSAVSPSETAKRMRIIKHSLSRLGGHGDAVAMAMNATMIANGDLVDQMSDRKRNPGWNTVRAPTVITMPDALESHWLNQYANLLRNFDEDDIDGQEQALKAATGYYAANRDVMDRGHKVSWDHVKLEPGEISAIQHALNILILEGEEVFDAECQNSPSKRDVSSYLQITKKVSEKRNGYDRKQPPEYASSFVFHIDVHDDILYWSQACCQQDFTGAIVAYGSWPHQPTSYFSHSKIKKKLSSVYPGSTENAIKLGLIDLIKDLAQFPIALSCGLIDAGYKPEIVSEAIRLAGVPGVYSSRGIGIGPSEKPMSEYDLSAKRCLKKGPDPNRPRWYFPREFKGRLHFDANFWKDFAASRLTQIDASGSWTLYGSERIDHGFYADHLISEEPLAMSARGRTCNVWRVVAGRDNHYWDTFVGCVVASSVAGAQLPGLAAQLPKKVVSRARNRVQDLNW